MLWSCTAFLVAAGIAALYLKLGLGHDSGHGLVPKFDLDAEMNIPTWFSSLLLAIASALFGYIALVAAETRQPFVRHWRGLALIFLLMSADETAGLHGLLTRPVRNALDLGGALYYAWVVPVGAALIVFLLAYARFTWHLPPRTRTSIVIAGIVYVTGALGGELLEGAWRSSHGVDLVFGAMTVVEETLEMVGVLLLIHTLMKYLGALR